MTSYNLYKWSTSLVRPSLFFCPPGTINFLSAGNKHISHVQTYNRGGETNNTHTQAETNIFILRRGDETFLWGKQAAWVHILVFSSLPLSWYNYMVRLLSHIIIWVKRLIKYFIWWQSALTNYYLIADGNL